MQPSEGLVAAGQAVYTPGMLSIYDIGVLIISNSYIWKCPSSRIEAHAYSGDSDHRYWFYSITRFSQRDASDGITVRDRIESVRS